MNRIKFYTLGCKVNRYETQVLMQKFANEGFVEENSDDAEVYVVNSCTVTAEGDRKTRQTVRKIRREHPDSVVALTGCYPQAFPQEAQSIIEADVITGSKDRAGLVTAVKQYMATGERVVAIAKHTQGEEFESMSASDFSEMTRAFIKIEDGCENFCSYCIIPTARGPVRSKPIMELKKELTQIGLSGYKEVVLAGINLSAYGRDLPENVRLVDAVRIACETTGIERVRLGSIEPDTISPQDISAMSQLANFCPQFHLSLQSGSDTVLKRMNRHYTTADYLSVVHEIKKQFPTAAITTDMMVGFPGETDDEHQQSVDFARLVGFSKIHVFAYSPRGATKAAQMSGQVDSATKKKRSAELSKTASELRTAFLNKMVGEQVNVLFEERSTDGNYTGYSENYTPVSVSSLEPLSGKIQQATIISVASDGCLGIV